LKKKGKDDKKNERKNGNQTKDLEKENFLKQFQEIDSDD